MEDIIRRGALRVLATESSCDVVISCIGYKLMAHRIILSMASSVLQDLLQQDNNQPTVLIFPDISAATMTLILDYIYSGHVTLLLSQLSDFLTVSSLLNLKVEEDYLKMLKGACESDGGGCSSLKLSCDYFKYKLEGGLKKRDGRRAMPGLIPIAKVRNKKGLFNKVFPSPWTPRDEQVLKDPRVDCVLPMDCTVEQCAVDASSKRNDSNNNIDLDDTQKPTSQVEESASRQKESQSDEKVADGQLGNDPNKEVSAIKKLLAVNRSERLDEPSVENAEKVEVKEKPYKCSDCGKGFSQLRNYKYHRSIHDGSKKFSTCCPECGKVFNDRGYLSSHMKIHRDRKEYACQHCPKRFNQRVAYNMHLRIHTGVKPHACADCGKSFSRKMLLKQHQRVHTGERPYTCQECGKSFADRSNMSLHARLHTGVKPYSCTVCPKSFTKKHHLKTHMNFHMGIKPYTCQKCGLAFSQSSNMRTHYKKCILKSAENNT